jgi:hypothetical protein
MNRIFVWLGALLVLTACSSPDVSLYSKARPALKLEEYFSGTTKAWGMVQERSGKVARRFTVDITGNWNEATQTLVLDEKFVYDDGEKDGRVWTLTQTSPGIWSGTGSNGVVGKSIGKAAGNAFQMSYYYDLPYKGTTLRVHMDDWMFLQDDGVLLNRTQMSKWGFHLADVIISFQKLEQPAK